MAPLWLDVDTDGDLDWCDSVAKARAIRAGFWRAIQDFDGDGFSDVYLLQNFFAPQPETGRMDGGLSLLLKGDGTGGVTPVGPAESGLLVSGDAKGLGTTDWNQDGWPDLVIGQNDQPTKRVRHVGVRNRHPLAIRLQGTPGNLSAVGARVSVRREDGVSQTAEVYAGSGYLSQSAPVLFFGRGRRREPLQVTVRWPDGHRTEHTIDAQQDHVVLPERE
jgi:hypothetical protein